MLARKFQTVWLKVSFKGEGGVRYTVPGFIRPDCMDENLTVRFRVGNVYQNCSIVTYFDDREIARRKRPVMAPGEMEQIILQKKQILENDVSRVKIVIEPNS